MIANRSRWLVGVLVWCTSWSVLAADSFAAGVLSCAAESDRERRLDCYDRAVASYTAALSSAPRTPATTGAAPAAPVVGAVARVAPAAAPGSSGTAASADASNPSSPPASAAGKSTPLPKHIAARIVSIDHFPEYVVVHLDNQQTWKQVSDSSGSSTLHNGELITIDREVGTYWLAGAKGDAVQVKLEAPTP
jgi:hypothetical protein